MANPTDGPPPRRFPHGLRFAEPPPSPSPPHDGGGGGSDDNNNNNNNNNNNPPSRPGPNEPDPDPFPASADPRNVTPAEDAAVDAWWSRNATVWTTIPWHRFAAAPAWASWLDRSVAVERLTIFEALSLCYDLAGRRLTTEERDVLVEAHARANCALSYMEPANVGLSAFIAWQSWRKTGAQQMARQAAREAAAAAAAAAAGGGAAGGHITHFSIPQPHQHYNHPPSAAYSPTATGGLLLRRLGRAALAGLVSRLVLKQFYPTIHERVSMDVSSFIATDERLLRWNHDVQQRKGLSEGDVET